MEKKLSKIEADLIDVIEDIMKSKKWSADNKVKILSDANSSLICIRLLKAKVEV